jgi:uncharacterized membrane protein YphA (DoxX/SURF4 family)
LVEKQKGNPFYAFLYGEPARGAQYVFVALRIIMGIFWLYADQSRWIGLATGNPVVIPPDVLRKNLPQIAAFGIQNSTTVFYIATTFETVAAILLILGLATRLGALWGVVEFFINGTTGTLIGSVGLFHDYGLFGMNLVLLLYGSKVLSIDGLIARMRAK